VHRIRCQRCAFLNYGWVRCSSGEGHFLRKVQRMNLDYSALLKFHRQLSVSERTNVLVNMRLRTIARTLDPKPITYQGLHTGLELGACMLLYS